jgi:predicted AAA+ superfamily ATPase
MLDQLYTKHQKALERLKTRFRSNLHDQIQWNERLIGLKGARGVGKTTLVLQHIKEVYGFDRSCLYVNLDDIAFSYDNLVQLAEEFERTGGKHLFFDEIHKYANWSQELKNIYDSFPDLNVVFTGSSILDILKGKADLSRRAVVYRMQGLSFREFLQIESGQQFDSYSLEQVLENHEQLSREINSKVKPFRYFEQYLRYGYYPYYLESIENYTFKLSNTLSLMIETDLPLLLNVDMQYIGKLKKFLNLLSSNIPFKPNVSNLAAGIGISWQSVINYLRYLDEAEIVKIIYHEGKDIKSLSKPDMLYLHHPNHFYVFNDELTNKGNLRESFFVNQLAYKYTVETAKRGDFVVNGKYNFEIGGKNKTYHQISNLQNSFIAADDIEYGFKNKIPLWLFGLLY